MGPKGPRAPAAPGDTLRHPLILGLLLLWALNDHVLKEQFGNQWTGKLSDLAGLAVFPLVLLSAYEFGCALARRPARKHSLILWLSLVATGAFMIGINLSPAWADEYTRALGVVQWPFQVLWSLVSGAPTPQVTTLRVTMDPSDLWTLPALTIPWWVARAHVRALSRQTPAP